MKRSLRLCGLLLAALLAGCSAHPEEDAMALIQHGGGKLATDAQGRVTAVDLSEARGGSALLGAVAVLPTVHTVNCSNAQRITDKDIALLARLPHLETLYLGGTDVDDNGLRQIQQLKSLKTLHLGHTRITDAGMSALDPLTNLQTLVLSDTAITDKGIVHLRDLRGLSTLILKRTKISSQGINELRRTLPHTRIDD